jgi:hypothetical protein
VISSKKKGEYVMQKKVIGTRLAIYALTAIMTLAMLMGSAYAFADYSQHKTGDFESGGDFLADVTLIEDFKPEKDWEVGEKVKKVTKVRANESNTDPIFVRIALKEYLEKTIYEYKLTENRYMIDEKGEFYKFDNEVEAKKKSEEIKGSDVEWLKPFGEDKYSFYIKCTWDSINGIYGKFIIENRIAISTSLFAGSERRGNSELNGNQGDSKEYKWPRYNENKDNPIRDYVYVDLEDKKVALGETIDASVLGKNWILVESKDENGNDSSYFYWGSPLFPGEDTRELTKSVKLLEKDADEIYYGIRTDLEAVTLTDADADGWVVASYIDNLRRVGNVEDLQKAIGISELDILIENDIESDGNMGFDVKKSSVVNLCGYNLKAEKMTFNNSTYNIKLENGIISAETLTFASEPEIGEGLKISFKELWIKDKLIKVDDPEYKKYFDNETFIQN